MGAKGRVGVASLSTVCSIARSEAEGGPVGPWWHEPTSLTVSDCKRAYKVLVEGGKSQEDVRSQLVEKRKRELKEYLEWCGTHREEDKAEAKLSEEDEGRSQSKGGEGKVPETAGVEEDEEEEREYDVTRDTRGRSDGRDEDSASGSHPARKLPTHLRRKRSFRKRGGAASNTARQHHEVEAEWKEEDEQDEDHEEFVSAEADDARGEEKGDEEGKHGRSRPPGGTRGSTRQRSSTQSTAQYAHKRAPKREKRQENDAASEEMETGNQSAGSLATRRGGKKGKSHTNGDAHETVESPSGKEASDKGRPSKAEKRKQTRQQKKAQVEEEKEDNNEEEEQENEGEVEDNEEEEAAESLNARLSQAIHEVGKEEWEDILKQVGKPGFTLDWLAKKAERGKCGPTEAYDSIVALCNSISTANSRETRVARKSAGHVRANAKAFIEPLIAEESEDTDQGRGVSTRSTHNREMKEPGDHDGKHTRSGKEDKKQGGDQGRKRKAQSVPPSDRPTRSRRGRG